MNQDEEFKQQIRANDAGELIAELEAENKSLRHILSLWKKTEAQKKIEELEEQNRKLRLELHTLRFKESQEQRFIWWIWNVYSRNVTDLIYAIIGATTFDTEGEAKGGKWTLPKHCFDLMKRISEYTEKIYDGTYLDVEISTDVKKGIPENKPAHNENANSLLRSAWMIANRNGEQTNWEAFKNAVYKELVEEHNVKTSTDNTKLDVSSLEYAAKWIENSLVGETNERVIEFAKNMAMSIRAAKPSQSDGSVTQNRRFTWRLFKTSWAAPAVNKRYLVKLKNNWVTIATYYIRVGGGYWKDDRGQELGSDAVVFWKGLEE